MVAAGIRALVINGAQPTLTIQVIAIVVAHALQGEDARLLVEALDQSFLLQALGDVFWWIAQLEFIDHANADQVLDLDLHRQGAAAGNARAAHRGRIFGPGIETIDLGGGDQVGLHHRGFYQACASGRAIIPGLVDF